MSVTTTRGDHNRVTCTGAAVRRFPLVEEPAVGAGPERKERVTP